MNIQSDTAVLRLANGSEYRGKAFGYRGNAEGEAVFSCNLRSFKPFVDELEKYGVEIEDISPETIPEDFARTPKIHKCYLVRRG